MGDEGQFIVNIKGFNKDQGHKLKALKQHLLLRKRYFFTSKIFYKYSITQPRQLCSIRGSVTVELYTLKHGLLSVRALLNTQDRQE